MIIPPYRDSIFLTPCSNTDEISVLTLKYGRKNWLQLRDEIGIYTMEVRTLDFRSFEYRDAQGCKDWKQCTAIPEKYQERYRKLIYAFPFIELVFQGSEYNVPISGEKIYPEQKRF